jgi:hypothetical protein
MLPQLPSSIHTAIEWISRKQIMHIYGCHQHCHWVVKTQTFGIIVALPGTLIIVRSSDAHFVTFTYTGYYFRDFDQPVFNRMDKSVLTLSDRDWLSWKLLNSLKVCFKTPKRFMFNHWYPHHRWTKFFTFWERVV